MEIAYYTSDVDITAYKVLLYNGNGGAVYSTLDLPAGTPTSSGVVSVTSVSASGGLQNGPDGIALIDGSTNNTVVEFISYEGSFVASNGAAAGFGA